MPSPLSESRPPSVPAGTRAACLHRPPSAVITQDAETLAPQQMRAVLTSASIDDTGRTTVLEPGCAVTLGRHPSCTLALRAPTVSAVHAEVQHVGGSYVLLDKGSTNGTFVNDQRLGSAHALRNGDTIRLGPTVLLRFSLMSDDEHAAVTRLYEMAVHDRLTGLYNRNFADERLDSEIAYASAHGTTLAVILVDLDHFKSINDRHGHLAGDNVLRAAAGALGRSIRGEDLVARYGGEEFLVMVRGMTGRDDAAITAERIRNTLAALRVPQPAARGTVVELGATASLGVAALHECAPASRAGLIEIADRRLYAAKLLGRNRVVSSG